MDKLTTTSKKRGEELVAELVEGSVAVTQTLGLMLGKGGIQTMLLAPGFETGLPVTQPGEEGHDFDYAWTVAHGTYHDASSALAILEADWPDEEISRKLLFDLTDKDVAFAVLTIAAFDGEFAVLETNKMPDEITMLDGDAMEALFGEHGVTTFSIDAEDPTFKMVVTIAMETLSFTESLAEFAKTMGGPIPVPGASDEFARRLAEFEGPKH